MASLPVVDMRRLARDERADLAAFLATLSPRQWLAPTLCAQWRVRDVVAHVISYDDLAERLLPALRIALIAPGIGGPWRIRGVRLVATDLRFTVGMGPQAQGTAEALLMARAGRLGVMGELSGPGRAKLAAPHRRLTAATRSVRLHGHWGGR